MSRFEGLNKYQTTLLLSSVLLLIFVLLFSIAEIGVRVRAYIKYGGFHGIENSYKLDEVTGLRIPIPNSTTGGITINSLGFRGPEIDEQKPKNRIRLAFLGASTTYCAEVSKNEMVWTDILTQKLGESWSGKQFDYINGGVSGYTLSSSLQNLKLRVSQLQPDVIFIYHSVNDLSKNTKKLASSQGLIPTISRKNGGLSWFSKYSLLSYLVEKNLSIIALQNRSEEAQGLLSYEIPEIIEPFEKDLRELVDESKKTAQFVVLITFSQRIRAEQNLEEKNKAAVTSLFYMPYLTADSILKGLDSYNNVIRRVAREKNVYLIDNNNIIPGDGAHFNDSVHFTDQGSQKMANRIFNGLANSQQFMEIFQ